MPQVKRILVTGGAGFLGSHLCDRLVDEGHDVICLDNFFTSQKSNVAHLLERAELRARAARRHASDHARSRRDLQPRLPRRAGPLPVQPDQDDEDLGDRRDQHAGHGQALPGEDPAGLDERSLRRPRSPSAARGLSRRGEPDRARGPATTKASGRPRRCSWTTTACTTSTCGSCGSSTPTARGCIPYDGRVVSNFIRQALRGEDITIFGDGSQTRSFCYRDDLVEGIIRMMNGPDDFHGPVNLGNQGEFTILELAKLVIEQTGSKSKIVHRPLPQDDPTRRQPDITLARKQLGWEPKVPLQEGPAKDDRLVPLDRVGRLPGADAELLIRGDLRTSSGTGCRRRSPSANAPHAISSAACRHGSQKCPIPPRNHGVEWGVEGHVTSRGGVLEPDAELIFSCVRICFARDHELSDHIRLLPLRTWAGAIFRR